MVPRTPTKRGALIGLALAGYSPTDIARRLDWPPSTVRYTLKRWEQHHTAYDLPRSGRPRVFDTRGERQILWDFLRHPHLSFADLGKQFGISKATIRRIANKHGYSRRIRRRVVHITPSQVKRRRAWAEQNRGQDWSRVIFTDEMSMELGQTGREWTTRRAGQEYQERHLQVRFRSGRRSIMVWGAVAKNRKWPLLLLPTTAPITAKRYCKEVLPVLGQHARELKRRIWQPALVVEDNAPIHNATISVIKRHQLKLNRLEHPAASPDLNPIENLWSLVKQKVARRFPRATNTIQLFEHAQEAWEAIPMEVVNNVIDSMEARRQGVQDAKGGHTRY